MPILRCVFWLMIVYAAILTHGTFRFDDLPGAATAVVRHDVSHLMETAAAGATAACARHADACVTDAARLTALFAGAESQTAAELASITGGDVPVPLTRHRKRDARLTRTP